jgi:hypothetical protein
MFEAEPFQSRDHLAARGFAGRHSKKFTDGDTHRRRDLHHDSFRRIAERLPDFVNFLFRHECAGRAYGGALAAVDAFAFAQILAERRQHRRVVAAKREVNRTDALNLRAESHAVATEHALVWIAHERERRTIHRRGLMHRLEPDFLDAKLARDILQLASGALAAGGAFALVIGEQKLDGNFADLADFLGLGADF